MNKLDEYLNIKDESESFHYIKTNEEKRINQEVFFDKKAYRVLECSKSYEKYILKLKEIKI